MKTRRYKGHTVLMLDTSGEDYVRKMLRAFRTNRTPQQAFERAYMYTLHRAAGHPLGCGGIAPTHRWWFAQVATDMGLDDSIVWMDDVSDPEEVERFHRTVQTRLFSEVMDG